MHAGLAPYKRRSDVALAGIGHFLAHLLAVGRLNGGAHDAVAQHVLIPVAHSAHRERAAAVAHQTEQAASNAGHAVAVVDAIAVAANVTAAVGGIPVLVAGDARQYAGARRHSGAGQHAHRIAHRSAGGHHRRIAHNLLVAGHAHVLVQEHTTLGAIGRVAAAVDTPVVHIPIAGTATRVVVGLHAGNVHE